MVVWGSSLGWLVFYSALTYGVKSRGVELLEGLCSISVEVARELGVEGASFCCGDMLQDGLADAKVLLLASQCWDAGQLSSVATAALRAVALGLAAPCGLACEVKVSCYAPARH